MGRHEDCEARARNAAEAQWLAVHTEAWTQRTASWEATWGRAYGLPEEPAPTIKDARRAYTPSGS